MKNTIDITAELRTEAYVAIAELSRLETSAEALRKRKRGKKVRMQLEQTDSIIRQRRAELVGRLDALGPLAAESIEGHELALHRLMMA